MQASEYLELQYTLSGFSVAANWANYSVSTNLPNGRHDVDYGNAANHPTPAATAITTKDLVAGRQYYLTISWNEPLQAGQQPQIRFNWVPSHLAKAFSLNGLKCA